MKWSFGRIGFGFLFVFVAMSATHVCAESAYNSGTYIDPAANDAWVVDNSPARKDPISVESRGREAAAFYSDNNTQAAEVDRDVFLNDRSGVMTLAYLEKAEEKDFDNEDEFWVPPADTIKDPLEFMNRAFFHFNDKLYFWFLKPVAQGYRVVVPKTARIGVSNFFYNLAGPVRMVNCLLQGKGEEAGFEFARLLVNTTIGLGGLMDVATHSMELDRYNEDLGQTLGVYGCGPSFYLHWPFLGPSSGRDTLGIFGDAFLSPMHYLAPQYAIGARTYERVNETSLTIGNYEDFKRSAIDPYVAIRDAYYQNRENMIRK